MISITFGSQPGSGQVFVTRKEGVTLRIPLQATNLSTDVPTVPTKLMMSGLEELITIGSFHQDSIGMGHVSCTHQPDCSTANLTEVIRNLWGVTQQIEGLAFTKTDSRSQ